MQDKAGFLALPNEALGDLLSSDEVAVEELSVFRTLAEWINHDRKSRQLHFHDLFGEIRHLALISGNEHMSLIHRGAAWPQNIRDTLCSVHQYHLKDVAEHLHL